MSRVGAPIEARTANGSQSVQNLVTVQILFENTLLFTQLGPWKKGRKIQSLPRQAVLATSFS